MTELRLRTVEVLECWEQGTVDRGRITHGWFSADDERGAAARYQQVLARTPWLAQQGSLGITRQRLQVLEPANTDVDRYLPAAEKA